MITKTKQSSERLVEHHKLDYDETTVMKRYEKKENKEVRLRAGIGPVADS